MTLQIDITDQIATLTLNRPEAMNSIDPDTRRALQAAWLRVAADDTVRVVVLTGAGDRAFCTGADLKRMPPPPHSPAVASFGQGENQHLLAGMQTDKPLIAAINGFAMGGGLELALACDIRIAADQAEFALSEVRIGSMPGAGGTQTLIRAIGRSDAMLMLLTGDRIDATEALRIGLVSKVVPQAALMATARGIAERIASNAPLSVRAVKRLARDGADMPLPSAIAAESYAFALLRDTEDRQEGRSAFQSKRPPVFKGR
jgi:E-phenylitaconyl-CoA hydratase